MAIIFTGCGTKIKLGEYKKSLMQKSKYLPSAEKMITKKTRVLITKFDDSANLIGKKANLGKVAVISVANQLLNSGSVDVIKRESNFIDLKKELRAAELSKELGVDTGSAEFLITGKIFGASFGHQYLKGRVWRDNKGRRHKTPDKFQYRACSKGLLNIYKLPSMRNIKGISFNGCVTKSETTNSRYGARERDDGLVQESIQNGISGISSGLKNRFTKIGYILEKRVNDDETIVLTTLGRKVGAKESEDVNIYSIKTTKNSITGEELKQNIKIGEGKISNQISQNSSWIVVKELDDGENIKIGDFIKIIY